MIIKALKYLAQAQGAKKSNLLLKITWRANENRKLWVRVKTIITGKLIAINLVTAKR